MSIFRKTVDFIDRHGIDGSGLGADKDLLNRLEREDKQSKNPPKFVVENKPELLMDRVLDDTKKEK